MKVRIDILRQNPPGERYWQSFYSEIVDSGHGSDATTVASLLEELNSRDSLMDIDGNEARRIEWECSCLQKKCGACAMVIDGTPMLACDARIEPTGTEITVKLEPLRKFPVVRDLVVDRSVIFDNLKEMEVWLKSDTDQNEVESNAAYEPSRCMQCGCCLEICPNFYPGGKFLGMSNIVSVSRILAEQSGKGRSEELSKLRSSYKRHAYEGCGKSLSCKAICPAGIDTENLMVRSNAAAIWGRTYIK